VLFYFPLEEIKYLNNTIVSDEFAFFCLDFLAYMGEGRPKNKRGKRYEDGSCDMVYHEMPDIALHVCMHVHE